MEALLAEAEISFSKRKKSQRQIEVSEVKMMFNSLKEVSSEYRILHGEKGKRYYVLSAKFWKFVQAQMENRKLFKKQRDAVKYIVELTKGEITQRAVEGWAYSNKIPFIVEKFKGEVEKKEACPHGFAYFCVICNLNVTLIENCPVKPFWITSPQGKAYVYKKYWEELKEQVEYLRWVLTTSEF